MAISFVGASPLAAAVSTSSLTVDISAIGVQQNDIILFHAMSRSDVPLSVSGYTEKIAQQLLVWCIPALFYKRAGASEGNPVLTCPGVGTGGVFAVCTVWRGCVTSGDPFDALTASWHQDTSTSSTTLNYDAITTVTNGAMVIGWGVGDDDDGPISTPLTWSEAVDLETTTGNDLCVQIIYMEMPVAGSTLATSATKTTGGRDISRMVALKPAVGGAAQTISGGGVEVLLDEGGGELLGTYLLEGGGVEVLLDEGGGRPLPGPLTMEGGGISIPTDAGGGRLQPITIIDGGGLSLSLESGAGELIPHAMILEGGGVEQPVVAGGGRVQGEMLVVEGGGVEQPVVAGGGELSGGPVTFEGGGVPIALAAGGGSVDEYVPPVIFQRPIVGVGK